VTERSRRQNRREPGKRESVFSLLLGIYFWREGFEAAFEAERRGRKGGDSLNG
jgi:hypothetical protein